MQLADIDHDGDLDAFVVYYLEPARVYLNDGGAWFAASDADIIISDWAPELDGISFIERVRKDPNSPNPYVPIIVCSGNTERRQVIAARDAGMSEYLVKPVSPKSIYSRICSVLENDRVFVRNGKYFGPDRRRRSVVVGKERRKGGSA